MKLTKQSAHRERAYISWNHSTTGSVAYKASLAAQAMQLCI